MQTELTDADDMTGPARHRTLHCMAFGRDGAWEAICLDLDLAAQGVTFEEAAAALNEAIALHVESVMALPEAERRPLLNRPVPLATRLAFAWRALTLALSRRDTDLFQHQFTMPSPA